VQDDERIKLLGKVAEVIEGLHYLGRPATATRSFRTLSIEFKHLTEEIGAFV